DRKVCHACAGHLFDLFRQHLSDVRIMGPAEPIIARIRNQYLMTIPAKIPRGYAGLQDVKLRIQDCVATILKEKEYRNARVVLDVDPVWAVKQADGRFTASVDVSELAKGMLD